MSVTDEVFPIPVAMLAVLGSVSAWRYVGGPNCALSKQAPKSYPYGQRSWVATIGGLHVVVAMIGSLALTAVCFGALPKNEWGNVVSIIPVIALFGSGALFASLSRTGKPQRVLSPSWRSQVLLADLQPDRSEENRQGEALLRSPASEEEQGWRRTYTNGVRRSSIAVGLLLLAVVSLGFCLVNLVEGDAEDSLIFLCFAGVVFTFSNLWFYVWRRFTRNLGSK